MMRAPLLSIFLQPFSQFSFAFSIACCYAIFNGGKCSVISEAGPKISGFPSRQRTRQRRAQVQKISPPLLACTLLQIKLISVNIPFIGYSRSLNDLRCVNEAANK